MSKAFLARTMIPTEPTKVQNSSMLSGKRYNQETLSPFDVTLYKGGGRAGALPALTHRAEAEEEAFSSHVHTSRSALAPSAFLKRGEGLGGRSNAALAVEAKAKRATLRVAPILHQVRARHRGPPVLLREHLLSTTKHSHPPAPHTPHPCLAARPDAPQPAQF